jgi:hypothetical protein
MATTHPTAVRNAIADLVVDKLDLGSGTASGRLEILTSGDVLLVSLPLSNPAFGAASTGTATASAITTTNATVAGTAAKYNMVDRDDTIIFSGSVTESGGGGDLIITNTDINVGDPISVSSFAYTAAA